MWLITLSMSTPFGQVSTFIHTGTWSLKENNDMLKTLSNILNTKRSRVTTTRSECVGFVLGMVLVEGHGAPSLFLVGV